MDDPSRWHSPESEVSVLGGLLHGFDPVELFGTLDASDFFDERNRLAFRAMVRIHGRGEPLDSLSVQEELKTLSSQDPDSIHRWLVDLEHASVGATAANVPYRMGIVRKYARRRKMLAVAEEMARNAGDLDREPEELIQAASLALEELEADGPGTKSFPEPRSVGEILSGPEPEESWLAKGLIPAGGNVLIAAYPKSFKTFFHMELAVAVATGTPFLGRYDTASGLRTGMVLLEGGEREQACRIDRLAQGRGMKGEHLDGLLHVWHRPPLRFSNLAVMAGLGSLVKDLELDVLVVDSWAYAADGDSNSADEVTPQLFALSQLREYRPGLTVILIHHARKSPGDGAGNRLTDIIRNSSAFGGWYDAGLVLSRKDESSPVTIRAELRDHPSVEPFAFTVEDEEPATRENGWTAQGWIRLSASERTPQSVEREADIARLIPAVREFVRENPACSRNRVRKGVKGDNTAVEGALEYLQDQKEIRIEEPPGPGHGAKIYPDLLEVV